MRDRLARAIDPTAFEEWEYADPGTIRSLDQQTRQRFAYAAADRVIETLGLTENASETVGKVE